MKPAGSDPLTTPESESADVSVGPPAPRPCPADVRLCGHLRKQKSLRRRFFVLRADPPRLEYYKSEKKFLAGGCRPARPQRSVSLEGACTISKRADARQRHLIVLYTRDRSLGVAAANEAEQQAWYSALLEVRAAAAATATGPSSHEDPEAWILAPFQDVWPVTLRPKGLGRSRGLGSGSYRLCLGSGALSLLRKPGGRGSQDGQAWAPPALRLSLLSVRRCGHADSFFFLELGRSAPTGPGELWLRAPDAVVAQSIHETVLAAMKRLGGSGAIAKAELLPRDPLTGVPMSPVTPPYETRCSATQPRSLGEKMKQATLNTLTRLGAAVSCPEGLEWGVGYIAMGARDGYVYMGGEDEMGYVSMTPPGDWPDTAPCQLLPDSGDSGYMPMNSFSPGPSSHKSGATAPRPGLQSPWQVLGDSWEPTGAQACSSQGSELPGEYVHIQYTPPGCAGSDSTRAEPPDSCLNYVDLDLVPPLELLGDAPQAGPHSYASIKF